MKKAMRTAIAATGLLALVNLTYDSMINKVEASEIPATTVGQFTVSGAVYDEGVIVNIDYNGTNDLLKGHAVDFSLNYGGTATANGIWNITQTLGPDLKTNYHMTTNDTEIGNFSSTVYFDGTQPTGLGSAALDNQLTLSIGYGPGGIAIGSIPIPTDLVKLLVPQNTAPVSNDISTVTDEDQQTYITLNSTDAENDSLTYFIDQLPQNGTLARNGNQVSYLPNKDYNGSDSFTYFANDTKADSNIATVNINVNPVNDAPVAKLSNVTLNGGNVTMPIANLCSDVDNDPLSIIITQSPIFGTLTQDSTNLYYNTTSQSRDGFSYQCSDGILTSPENKLIINLPPTHQVPVGQGVWFFGGLLAGLGALAGYKPKNK